MSSMKSAFNAMIKMKARKMTIQRLDEIVPVEIGVAHSNYSRNLSMSEEVVADGREFVISIVELDRVSYGVVKRGDILTDPTLGDYTISEIREMIGLGGEILGFRVRV